MHIASEFDRYFSRYHKIEKLSLVNNKNGNLFTISSFDTFLNEHIYDRGLFSSYTVQDTFRTKKEHFELWGIDSFLMPYNIMGSVFSNHTNLEEVFNCFFDFVNEYIGRDKYICVCSKRSFEEFKNVINKNCSDVIFVPRESLIWKRPLNSFKLLGEYIKIYKKSKNGFIPLIDCNVFDFYGRKSIDISTNIFTLECIRRKVDNIYESIVFQNVDVDCTKKLRILDTNKIHCILLAIVVLLSHNVVPCSSKQGSILRRLFNFLHERIYFSELDIDSIDFNSNIEVLCINLKKIIGANYKYDLEKIIYLFEAEIKRVKNNNRYSKKNLNVCQNKSNNELSSILKTFNSRYGINPKIFADQLQKETIITENDFEYLFDFFTYKSNVTINPIRKDISNEESIEIDNEFLKKIFFSKKGQS